MQDSAPIPVFNLFGEVGTFPDVIHCERIRDRAPLHEWVISPHRHREMAQILILREGGLRARLDNHDIVLRPGQFLFIPAQVVHGFAFRRGSEGLVLSLPLTVITDMRPTSAALIARLSRPFSGRMDDEAQASSDRLVAAFGRKGAFRANLLVALSHALLARLCSVTEDEKASARTPAQHRIQAFDLLIAQHMGDGWTAADYAGALSITPGHLNRLCRAATGQSVSDHIETAVMTEASRLLAFTQIPVAEIGYRLGYDDPSYFSRRFRRFQGETPSGYRGRYVE